MDASHGGSAIFPMPQIPTLFLPPPPPPAAAALPSSSLSVSSSARHGPASITSFPLLVLTVLGILTTSLLLLAYYVFVIRCCLTWHHHNRRGTSSSGVPSRRTATSDSSSAPAPASEEPPRGLEDAAIRALPAFTYCRRKPAAAAASECAVCLGEFEEGDRVRMLPACLHAFHVACIDAWLHGNANCPLCRAHVAAHCLLPPPPPMDQELRRPDDDDEVVVIQIPGPSAAEEDQDTPPQQQQQQQEAVVAVAPAEFGGEDTTTRTVRCQVGSEKAKRTINGRHDIGITITVVAAETKKGDVLPPTPRARRSLSMEHSSSMTGGEVHLQIHNALHHTDRDDRDTDSSSSS